MQVVPALRSLGEAVEMVKKEWNELETLIFQYAEVIRDFQEQKQYRERTPIAQR